MEIILSFIEFVSFPCGLKFKEITASIMNISCCVVIGQIIGKMSTEGNSQTTSEFLLSLPKLYYNILYAHIIFLLVNSCSSTYIAYSMDVVDEMFLMLETNPVY